MKKQLLIIGIILMLSLLLLSGCSSTESNSNSNPFVSKSDIRIIDKTSRTGYSGIDYCAFIDIVVKNYGSASGSAYVWAELKQDANSAEKRERVYLNSGESDSLTITFCELSFWSGSGFTYRVWIE